MKRAVLIGIDALVIAFLFVPAMAAFAQEEAPGNIAEIWTVHVKPEAQAAFEEAIRDHMPLRKNNEDPFHWETFMNNTGDNMTTYYFRACCFAWAARDAYDGWAAEHPQVDEHWGANVHPNVAGYEHHFDEIDFANSHWPEDMAEPKFVGVIEYRIKPGAWQAFNAVKGELSQLAKNNGWADQGHEWGWTSSVDGKPTVSLVIPHADYADMATPDPTFFEFLTEQLGSAEAAAAKFQSLSDATKGSSHQIYTHRPDLSTPD